MNETFPLSAANLPEIFGRLECHNERVKDTSHWCREKWRKGRGEHWGNNERVKDTSQHRQKEEINGFGLIVECPVSDKNVLGSIV